MANKHDPDYGNDRYSDEETAKRAEATVKAMIGMKPKPQKRKTRPQTRAKAKSKT